MMIAEHKIQLKGRYIECSCGWKFDFLNNIKGTFGSLSFTNEMRKAILSHKEDFRKSGDYIRLTPGDTIEVFRLRSACTEEEIKWHEKWHKL